MKSTKAKVLHEVAGEPLLGHVLRALREADINDVIVVVGHQREKVAEYLQIAAPTARTAVQEQMRGTGDAVRHAMPLVPADARTVMVLAGDTPLLTGATLRQLSEQHASSGAAATILSARLEDPSGYGRIVREGDQVRRIVEHKDASQAELAIDEINSGLYLFSAPALREGLEHLTSHNAQGEEYLTDVIGWLVEHGEPVTAHVTDDAARALRLREHLLEQSGCRIRVGNLPQQHLGVRRDAGERRGLAVREGGGHFCAGEFGEGGQHIDEMRGLIDDTAGLLFQTRRPVQNGGRGDAAFELVLLVVAERRVPRPGPAGAVAPACFRIKRLCIGFRLAAIIGARAVVGDEEDDGVVEFAMLFQIADEAAHFLVDAINHARIRGHALRLPSTMRVIELVPRTNVLGTR